MNLTEMLARTRIYVDDRRSDRFTDVELTGILNASQETVQKLIDDEDEAYFLNVETYAVVADTDALEFELPTGCTRIRLVETVAPVPVPAVPVDFRDRHQIPTEVSDELSNSSTQFRYYLRGTKIGIVAPPGSATIRVWYSRKVVDLSNAGDTSEIPIEFHDLVCLLAAQGIYGSAGHDMPKELRNQLDFGIAKLPSHIQNRQGQAAKYVRYIGD